MRPRLSLPPSPEPAHTRAEPAHEAFGAVDPVGRALQLNQPFTIAGVVSDVKYSKLDVAPPPEAYLPFRELPMLPGLPMDVAVRTGGDPLPVATGIRKLISEVDPGQPVYGVTTLEHSLSDQPRFSLQPVRTRHIRCDRSADGADRDLRRDRLFPIAQRTHEIGTVWRLARRGEVGMWSRTTE